MFGHIVKTIILTIFALIILHFIIEHTKIVWYIPKHTDYNASYKKIVELLDILPDKLPDTLPDTLPDKDYSSKLTESIKPVEHTNIKSINPMERELSEYITNIT